MSLSEAKSFLSNWFAEALLREGVWDPAIFKAFFMAGGPGSGKSYVSRQVTAGHGLVTVNSDTAFEIALKKAGISMKLDPDEAHIWGPIRAHAGELTQKRQAHWMHERLGLVIDGTGREAGKIQQQKHALEQLGYDTYMIFVNTSLDVALARNQQRERTVPEDVVVEAWNNVQKNIPVFHGMFGGNFILVHNDNASQDDLDVAAKAVRAHVTAPPKNPIALKWIADRGGTGAIAKWD